MLSVEPQNFDFRVTFSTLSRRHHLKKFVLQYLKVSHFKHIPKSGHVGTK